MLANAGAVCAAETVRIRGLIAAFDGAALGLPTPSDWLLDQDIARASPPLIVGVAPSQTLSLPAAVVHGAHRRPLLAGRAAGAAPAAVVQLAPAPRVGAAVAVGLLAAWWSVLVAVSHAADLPLVGSPPDVDA